MNDENGAAARKGGDAAGVGRGVIFISISKLWFMVSGYAIIFALPRILPPEVFGDYGVVIRIVSVLNAVLITGTIQAVSKFTSQEPRNAGAVKRAAISLQMLLGGGIFLVYLIVAPWIAEYENDAGLTPYLRLSSLIVISYSFYAVYMGFINGLKQFGKQAALDMTFSTLKLLLVVGLAFVMTRFDLALAGAIGGFGLAAFLVLVIAIAAVPHRPFEGYLGIGTLFRFSFFIMLFTFIITLLLGIDLLLLKKLGSDGAFAGYYTTAQYLAFIPYQAIISITFVLFPLISRLTHIDDRDRVCGYIKEALRYSLMIAMLIAVLFSANSGPLMRLLLPRGYESGAAALSILVFGVLCFAIFFVGATVITGSGRPGHSALLGAGALVISYGLNYILIPRYEMSGAAAASSIAMAAALAGSWIYLRARFGACLPLLSTARVCAAGAAVYAVSSFFPVAGVAVIGKFAVLSVVYVAILFALRELGADDLKRVKGII